MRNVKFKGIFEHPPSPILRNIKNIYPPFVLWVCLGLQAFKEGVPFKNAKRLASELEVAEEAAKARRKAYMKSIGDRNLV